VKSLRPTHPSTNTKLTKRSGWAPKGQRYRAHAPFGSWKTQTFIAGLRSHGIVAPFIVPMPSATSAISSQSQNAETTSMRPDMRPIECDTL